MNATIKQNQPFESLQRLYGLSHKRRAEAMLEIIDGHPLVTNVAAEDVYTTIIERGLSDAAELVQLSTKEQFVVYVDLASWQKDKIDPKEVLHWIVAARGDDEEAFLQKISALDIEVLELVYKKLARIHDLQENPDIDAEGATMETPDGKFLVEFTTDGVDEAAMRRLTFDLVAANPFEFSRFLESVRWDLFMELEEAAYQFRQGRLEDLGFPPREEAVKVFAWVAPQETIEQTPMLNTTRDDVDFVSAAFRGLNAVERQNIENEVRYLVNCVLVAEGAEPGDPKALRSYSEYARDTLNLGLEHLTLAQPSAGANVLRELTLKKIFQLGFSLTLQLKQQAERLLHEKGVKFEGTWLALDEETAALNALLRPHPLKAVKVQGVNPVPFRSKRELAENANLFPRVHAQSCVLRALLGVSPHDVLARFKVTFAELTPQRLFAAALVNAELDGIISAAPLPPHTLTQLQTQLFEKRDHRVSLRSSAGLKALEILQATFPDAGPELTSMVQRLLQAFLKDFGDGQRKAIMTLPIEGQLPLANDEC